MILAPLFLSVLNTCYYLLILFWLHLKCYYIDINHKCKLFFNRICHVEISQNIFLTAHILYNKNLCSKETDYNTAVDCTQRFLKLWQKNDYGNIKKSLIYEHLVGLEVKDALIVVTFRNSDDPFKKKHTCVIDNSLGAFSPLTEDKRNANLEPTLMISGYLNCLDEQIDVSRWLKQLGWPGGLFSSATPEEVSDKLRRILCWKLLKKSKRPLKYCGHTASIEICSKDFGQKDSKENVNKEVYVFTA